MTNLHILRNPLISIFLLLLVSVPALGQSASATGRVGSSGKSAGDDITRPRISGNMARRSEMTSGSATTSRGITTSESLEKRVFDLINVRRAEKGLKPLSWNPAVAGVARSHSREMALYDYFSHTDVEGYLVDNRATKAGIDNWSAIGENIAYLRGYADPAEYAVERWMLSPTHRDNLLDARWRETGIGLAIASDGTYFFTQVFMVD